MVRKTFALASAAGFAALLAAQSGTPPAAEPPRRGWEEVLASALDARAKGSAASSAESRSALPAEASLRARLEGDLARAEALAPSAARALADALRVPAQSSSSQGAEAALLARAWSVGILDRIARGETQGLAERSEALDRLGRALPDAWTNAFAEGAAACAIGYLAMRDVRERAELADAGARLARAEEIFRKEGDRGRTSWARTQRARTAKLRVEARAALDLLEESVALAAEDSELQMDARALRLDVLVGLAGFEEGRADARWLDKHLFSEESIAADARYSAALALGVWHVRRLEEPEESQRERLKRAQRAFGVACELGEHPLALGVALEWRALSFMASDDVDAARADLAGARAHFTVAGRMGDLRRCLLQEAWLEHKLGHLAEGLQLLREHRRQMDAGERVELVERLDHFKVLAFVACAAGKREEAASALEEVLVLEDETIRRAAPGFEVLLAAEAVESHGYLVALLGERARDPDPERRRSAFARAEAAIEHGRARLLRRALAARGASVAEPDPRAVPELPPLPRGLAQLRWFVSRRPELGHEQDRYVLLARVLDRIAFEDLGPVEEIDAEVERFLARWMARDSLGLGAETYAAEALALAQRVLGSTCAWFRSADAPIDRAVLMTDGAIERVPCAALVLSPAAAGARYGELDYLVRRTAVLHVPSLAILHALAEPNDAREALVLLSPDPKLTAARAEGDSLRAARAGARVLSGEEASSAELRRAIDAGRWGWLHLVAHAELDERGSPRLHLHGDPLRSEGVEALPLTPGVRVVLSACGTARGDFHRGEGIFGLWRSFLLAGASSVVATLFEVDDRTSAAWMGSFHREATHGRPVAEALRATQLRWLAGTDVPRYARGSAVLDAAHPFLWASYVCVGRDGGVLPPSW